MFVRKTARVTDATAGRVDRVVQSLTELSRGDVRGLFDHRCVRVNGEVETGAGKVVRAGDRIEVDYDKDRRYKEISAPRSRSFKIVYEDDSLLVVEKAPNVLSVPTGKGEDDTLVHEIARYLSKGPTIRNRAHIVHRLDRGTSGLLVFAKTAAVAHRLKAQFAQHKPDREYIAIVAGVVEGEEGTFRTNLATSAYLDQYSTDKEGEGKLAITHYKVERRYPDATRMRVTLETGRRNQIRVHFSEVGHPVLGDDRYRTELAKHTEWPYKRLALHATVLGFKHPVTQKPLRFTSPPPAMFQRFGKGLVKPRGKQALPPAPVRRPKPQDKGKRKR